MSTPQKDFFYNRRISLVDVARRIGRSQSYVIAVLNGNIKPAKPTIEKIDQLIAEIRLQETETC